MADESQGTQQTEDQGQQALGEQQQAQPETPEEPKGEQPTSKMTPDEFRDKLAKGEIDTSRTDVESYINELVDFDTSKKDAEQAQAEPQQEQSQPPPSEPEQNAVRYRTFKDFLAAARKETGDDIKDAHDLIQRAKNKKEQLTAAQAALQRWKNDATTTKSQMDTLQQTVQTLKSQLKEVEDQQQQSPEPSKQESQETAHQEPEIPELDWSEATEQEKADYLKKVREKDKKELAAQFKAELEAVKKSHEDDKKGWQQQVEENKRKEAQARSHEELVSAADEFVRRNPMFQFGDNKTVGEKEKEYVSFMNDLNYLSQSNPKYRGRNLPQEYLSGNQDVQDLVNSRGLTPPEGLKQFSLLSELVQIANNHNLYTNRMRDAEGKDVPNTGRPDFTAALAIKKQRDGVDLAEMQDARVKGAKEALDVVQQRQSAPPTITAREATTTQEQQKVSAEQVMSEIKQLQSRLSTMPPDQRSAAMATIEQKLASIGMQPSQPV